MLSVYDYCTAQRMLGQMEAIACAFEKESECLVSTLLDAIEVLDSIIDKCAPEGIKYENQT